MNIGVETAPIEQTIEYLRTLPAIRERCSQVFELAQQGQLEYFDYHPEREQAVIDFCATIIQRDFGTNFDTIPPHGRWRHLDAGIPRVEPMIQKWKASPSPPDNKEICRRIVDLCLVSVLLDAGAGNVWKYTEPSTKMIFSRSEGLGVASVNMFEDGFFSGIDGQPFRVDASGLARSSATLIASAMQVTGENAMVGLEGRAELLSKLSTALRTNTVYFGDEGRPGNLVDYLESQSIKDAAGGRRVHISALWHALIHGLAVIWPASRTTLGGTPLGDVWPCDALANHSSKSAASPGDNLVPFHKLTGWTTYSLVEPLQVILEWKIDGLEDMTGLPEYRNGGLLLDLGVLSLRGDVIPRSFYPEATSNIPKLPPGHPAIVEWRAMTVIELDRIAEGLRKTFGLTADQLTLAQVLESATWKGGREIAKTKRPETGGPPIEIESDGTVF
ncbi:DUF1688-domain-containing protein [Schizopora paradoxa]|uniref:DUF1688-domain-containing protein n=1 Tax=Schizopora paradoxa TaxID=27342 RepID=A0A0H2S6R6_9AGAM|nr:DUF1688-domain-containing protein [Schizopora paradoxa]